MGGCLGVLFLSSWVTPRLAGRRGFGLRLRGRHWGWFRRLRLLYGLLGLLQEPFEPLLLTRRSRLTVMLCRRERLLHLAQGPLLFFEGAFQLRIVLLDVQ
jgi:hypothetical protein